MMFFALKAIGNGRYVLNILRLKSLVIILSACMSIAGCEESSSSNQYSSLVVGGPKNISMLLLIAEHEGFFDDEALDVEFRPLQTGKIAQDALIVGDIDVGVLVDANIAFVRLQNDNDVRVFSVIQEKTDDALVVRRDRGILSASDLRGKTVGFLPATTSHVFLARYLIANDVDIEDVDLLSMTPPAMQAAIIRGDLDAVSIWQPFRFNAMESLGEAGGELNDPEVYVARAVLAAESSVLDARADEFRALVRALLRAEEFVAQNPDAAIEFLSTAISVPEPALRAAWDEYKLTVRLDQALVDLLNEEGAWIVATQEAFAGITPPDFETVIDSAILQSVAPNRVSLSTRP